MLLPRARRYGAPTRKRLPLWAGLSGLGICTFVIGVQQVFPYARVVEHASAALPAGHVLRVDRLERGWLPGSFTVHGAHVAAPGPEPASFTFDRIDVDLSLGPLLAGRLDARVDARGSAGRLRGRIGEGRAGGVDVDLVATDMALARLAGGTAIAGPLQLHVDLHLPGAVSAARGEVRIACADCTIESQPRVQVGPIDERARVADGVVCLAPWRGRSGDGAFTFEGGVRLADSAAGARADLKAGFAASPAFRAASPAHRNLASALDQDRAARGALAALRWTAASREEAPVDRCARLRQPVPPAAPPVAVAPRPPRVAAAPDPAGAAVPDPTGAAPELDSAASARPMPAPLEPEVPPLAPPPPAARPEQPAAELPLEY